MKINQAKIENLLNTSEPKNQMLIPNYQREFVWSDVEAKEFLDDIKDSDFEKPLFLGTFIFHRTENGFEIVDGQQRITTILLFLIACRESAKSKNFNNDFINNVQRNITIHTFSNDDGEVSLLKTEGKIGSPLTYMSKLNWSGVYEKEMGNKHNWNLINKGYSFIYKFLEEEISDSQEDLEIFIKKVLYIEYIEIVVDDKGEAISTFEKVNARGQHLAVYDLIKAFLFAESLQNPELKNVEEEWDEIKSNAENSDNKLKKILYFFYFSKKGYIQPSKLYRVLKELAESNIKTFVAELKSFSKFHSSISSQIDFKSNIEDFMKNDMKLEDTSLFSDEDRRKKFSKTLFSIGLFKVASVYPLIYSSFTALKKISDKNKGNVKKEVDALIDLLEFFEHFIFITTRIAHATSKYGGRLEKLYGKYCEEFSKDDIDFRKTVVDLKKDFGEIKIKKEEFIEPFTELSYKNRNDKNVFYYIFDKLNTFNKKGKEIRPSDATFYSIEQYKTMGNNIEHILAENNKEIAENQDSIHSIGNILIIHRKDNSKLGNKPVSEKIDLIKSWIEDGSLPNKEYLKDFIKYYEDDCSGKWNYDSIEKRTRQIGEKIYDLLKYY